jgi:thioredoxin-dependent peroxiredoxin
MRTMILKAPVIFLLMQLRIEGASAQTIPVLGGEVKDFELPNLAGGKAKLSQLTADGPVILVVLRGYPGYQCPICTAQVGEFLGKADGFKNSGASVVFVYPAPVSQINKHAEQFVKGKEFPEHFRMLLDPDFAFLKAYGLRWDAPNETSYPSTFVIDRQRKVTFAHVSKTHGGRAKAGNVLKALSN